MALRFTTSRCILWFQPICRPAFASCSLLNEPSIMSCTQRNKRHLYLTPTANAGHSHWQNTRHIKAAGDAIKSANSNRTAYLIRKAVKLAGTNPKTNAELAKAIQFGNDKNVPLKSMQKMITKAANTKNTETTVAVRGGNGCTIVITADATNPQVFTKQTRKFFGKVGGLIVGKSIIDQVFMRKAVVEAEFKEPTSLTDAETIALECNVEEVTPTPDSQTIFTFQGEEEELYNITNALTVHGLDIIRSEVEHVPYEQIQLTSEEKENWNNVLEKICAMEDVDIQSVFDNIDWES